MAYRYRLDDTDTGTIAGRFNSLPHAERELRACVGVPCRFKLTDRDTNEIIGWSGSTGGLR